MSSHDVAADVGLTGRYVQHHVVNGEAATGCFFRVSSPKKCFTSVRYYVSHTRNLIWYSC